MRIVFRLTMNRPVFRVVPQMCVKPRKSNVSGLPSPRCFRCSAACRPNSIRRVLSGCNSSPNFCKRSFHSLEEPLGVGAMLESQRRYHRRSGRRSRRPWRDVSASAGPTDRRRSAGRRSPAAVKPPPLAVFLPPSSTTVPSSDTPAFSHFWIRRSIRRSAIRCSMNLHQPFVVDGVEEVTDVCVEHPVHLLPHDAPPRAHPAHHAGCVRAGTHRRSPGSPLRKSG